MSDTSVIILAAGKGTRIKAKASRNKVAYHIGGRPLIAHTLKHLHQAGLTSVVVVVGFAAASVKQALGGQVVYAHQTRRLGTGHAVKIGLKSVPPASGTVVTMYGDDSAFYPPSLFTHLLGSHRKSSAAVSLVTVKVKDPRGLGRIVRDAQGRVSAIVEDKNATPTQRRLREINTGLFCFDKSYLNSALKRIKRNPVSGEYYLTDCVADALAHGRLVNAVLWPDSAVWYGVNTPSQLAAARSLWNQNQIDF